MDFPSDISAAPAGTQPSRQAQTHQRHSNRLKQEGIWRRLQTAEAPESKMRSWTLVHSRNYLHELEAAQPLPGKIHRIDDDTVICHDSLQAARFAAGAVVKAVDMVMHKKAWHAFLRHPPPPATMPTATAPADFA